MPQPLSRVRPNASVVMGSHMLADRSKLLPLVMRVIANGSIVDDFAGRLLASLLEADVATGVAMYQALTSADARKAALLGAAKVVLSEDDFRLLQAVLKATKPSRDRRNDFAHHLWGIAEQLPDALLLANPRDSLQGVVGYMKWANRINALADTGISFEDAIKEDFPDPLIPPDKIMVFSESDLRREAEASDEATGIWLMLTEILGREPSPEVDSMRHWLLSKPQVQQALQSMTNESGRE